MRAPDGEFRHFRVASVVTTPTRGTHETPAHSGNRAASGPSRDVCTPIWRFLARRDGARARSRVAGIQLPSTYGTCHADKTAGRAHKRIRGHAPTLYRILAQVTLLDFTSFQATYNVMPRLVLISRDQRNEASAWTLIVALPLENVDLPL